MSNLPISLAVAGFFALVQVVWYIAVIVFLYKIWQKVKLLPG